MSKVVHINISMIYSISKILVQKYSNLLHWLCDSKYDKTLESYLDQRKWIY